MTHPLRSPLLSVTFLACWIALGSPALAHAGPEHDIEELTDRLAKEGESADLFLQRAIEYELLSKHGEATRDLEHALKFEPHSLPIQRELSRTYFASGKTNEALQTANRGLEGAGGGADYAALLVVRAEILRAANQFEKAVADANRAIQTEPGKVEWYLFRSQLQAHLKQRKERITGLDDGIKETGSAVLQNERIDALIEDAQFEPALTRIEKELEESRWKSSWLIRRAKVRLATGKAADAKTDLESAVSEIESRLSVASPDPSLLADRGSARELLGNREGARKDYEDARDKGVAEDWLLDRIRILKEKEKSEAEKK